MKYVALIVLPFLLTGCTTAPGISDADATATSFLECLRPSRASGFTAIDDRHVIVTERPGNRDWLITTTGGCYDLEYASSLGIAAQSTSCVRKFDRIITREPGNRRIDRCFIDTLEVVEDAEAARALVESRQDTDAGKGESSDPDA